MKKSKIISGLMCTVMALSATLCSFSAPVSAVDEFTNLNQAKITEAMGAGWNLGNQFEAVLGRTPSETAWGNPTVTQNTFKMIKDAGFKSVRIPVSYFSKIGDGPNYTIDSSWLARIKEVVDMALSEGLYTIINMHGDGYNTMVNNGAWLLCNASESEQVTIRAKYEASWRQIAETFKTYDEHLIFESMNEEFDNTYTTPNRTYYENINKYNQIFVDTVRKTGANNDKRWLLIPGWNTDIEYTVGDYGFKLPTDTNRDKSIPANEQRIMISVHYYQPWGFCGEGSSSASGYTDVWGTDAEIRSLQDQLTRCYVSFVAKGYPVVIGECGAVNKSNDSSRIKFYNELCKASRSRGMIPVVWDNNGHGTGADKFGLFDRSTFTVTQPKIIEAIMNAYKGEPDKFEIVTPLPKNQALALIYWTKSSKTLTTVASGKADASMNGAVSVRYVLDCAPDVKFDQYSVIRLSANVSGTETKANVYGQSDIIGAAKCTAELQLTNPIKTGDSYTFYATTQAWREAADYVYAIRSIELLDKNGKVIKTISKAISKPATPVKTTSKPKATTRNASQVAKDKKAAQKAMKQAKLNTLKVKSNAKKKINVTWKKVKKAKGYQIQVSAKKNFKKVIFKKDLKKTKLTIKNKKIKSKKTYFVRVRAYATYKDKNGKAIKVYSKWNKKLRKVKVK